MDKSRNNKHLLSLFVITIVIIAWGADFIGIEYMLQYMSSGVYTLLRLMLGSIILIIISSRKNKGFCIEKKDRIRIFICGALAMSLYYTIEGLGIRITSASFGSLILATVPIFGIIGDRIVYKKKITLLQIICITISIIGVYLLVAQDLTNSKIMGLILILTAAVIWTFQIVYIKPLYEKYSLLSILTGIFISGTIFQIPIAIAADPYIKITPAGAAILVITTVICLVLGQAGYVYAVGNLSVTIVSAFENLLPVVTIIISFVLYGTTLSGLQIVGTILIIGSVMCIALKD